MSQINNEKTWRDDVVDFATAMEFYSSYREMNLGVIKRFAADLKERGRVLPLLMVSPINPRCYSERVGREFFPTYKADLQRFAEQNGLPICSITEEAGLVASDFIDFEGHIGNRPARQRATEALASRVSDLIKTEFFK